MFRIERVVLGEEISVVIPFYNTPLEYFKECVDSVKALHPKEIILVDDCSSDLELVAFARTCGCIYLKTSYQSGHDGLPFNAGVQYASGDYVCRVDSDDRLLAFPKQIDTDIFFARNERVKIDKHLKIEHLILAPRALCNGMIAKREVLLKYPYPHDHYVFGDVLFALRMMHNRHSWSVNESVNYFYRKREDSIQTSHSPLHHRFRLIETVARFCSLEKMTPEQAEYYLQLAWMNFKYGHKSLQFYEQHMHHSP
jgi:glycosyltransferase involved in cell wall biosynthesis